MHKKMELLERKLRKMIREELINEGPNSDAQIRIVTSMKNTCEKFLRKELAGLEFRRRIARDLDDFSKTTGN